MSNRMTILFCSCDKYKDLWRPFFSIFGKRWINCPYLIVLNTERCEFNFPELNIIKYDLYDEKEKPTYGKRMLDHLNLIKTPYVMLILDDFFIREDVDDSSIKRVLDYLDRNPNISSVRLTPYQEREAYNECEAVSDLPGYYWMPKCSGYKLNFQICIWRVDKLKQYWTEDDDPWTWEVFANIKTFSDDGFLIVGEDIGPLIDYGYKVNGQPLSDIYRGKWVKENNVEELFLENGIEYDFSAREYYNPETEIKHFRSLKIIPYVLKRIGIVDTLILCRYIFVNIVKRVLHMPYKKMSQYPCAFKKRYLKRRRINGGTNI